MPIKKATHQGVFPETLEKHALRLKGQRLVERMAQSKGRSLRYLGLTGREAKDVLTWSSSLNWVTVVERTFKENRERIDFESHVIFKLTPDFNGNVDIIYDDVWNYLSSDHFAAVESPPDIVNLDFCGGLVNTTALDYPTQRKAFQCLFDVERNHSNDFLLFVTLLPRDRGKQTYKEYLRDYFNSLRSTLSSSERKRLADALDQNERFHCSSNLALFKACLPLLVEDMGRSQNYIVRNVYTRLYTKMIHLAFESRFKKGALGVAPDFGHGLRILNAPMRKLEGDGTETYKRPPRIAIR